MMSEGYNSCISWMEQHMLACPSKKLMYIDCPGCGLQRGSIELLKGNFHASWQVYPPAVFIIATMLLLCVHLIFKLKYGAAIVKYLYIVTAIVILVNYISKFFSNQLI